MEALDLKLCWHQRVSQSIVCDSFGLQRVRGRKSHPEQIWSALPQIADIDFSRDDFSVGPKADLTAHLALVGQSPAPNRSRRTQACNRPVQARSSL